VKASFYQFKNKNFIKINNLNKKLFNKIFIIGDWGLGIGDWGLGGGAPAPNPQRPNPKPQTPTPKNIF